MSWNAFITVFVAALLAQICYGIFRSAVSSEELDEKLEMLKADIITELRPDEEDDI